MRKFIKNIKTRVIGSTIVEVIVALIICMIIFSISVSIILKSRISNNISLKQKASLVLSNISRNNLDEYVNFNSPEFTLSVDKEENDSIQDVYKVTISVFDSEGKVLGEKILLINNYNDGNTGEKY